MATTSRGAQVLSTFALVEYLCTCGALVETAPRGAQVLNQQLFQDFHSDPRRGFIQLTENTRWSTHKDIYTNIIYTLGREY